MAVQYAYTASGYLHRVNDAGSGRLYWQADAINAHGGVSLMILGNGLSAMRHRHEATGTLAAITIGALGHVLNLSYE